MKKPITLLLLTILTSIVACAAESGEKKSVAMTADRLGELILKVDPEAEHTSNSWEFGLENYVVTVIYDTTADRMRIVIPIKSVEDMTEGELKRVMQANFDSALDARYAIARNALWAAFIHPLSSLTDEHFLSSLGQTANIVATYGTSFSSGMFIFGGGDSGEIQRHELIERLQDLGTET